LNVSETAEKINKLYPAIRQISNSPNEIAEKINSILINGDGISANIMKSAWDYFMEKKCNAKNSGGINLV